MHSTYTKYGGVIGDLGGFGLCGGWGLLNAQVLHVATAEDNVLVDAIRRGDLLIGIALAALCAEGGDILERDGGFLRVNLVEGSDVSIFESARGRR